MTGRSDSHMEDVRRVLTRFAERITAQVTGMSFTADVFRARAYDLVGIMAVSAIAAPERELAVASLHLDRRTGEWVFDLIDRDARVLAVERTTATNEIDDLARIESFLDRSTEAVLAALDCGRQPE